MKNRDFFREYINAFLEENAKINLISKNDKQFLWEKHICDSLALERFFEKYQIPKTMLDIGTGGGFPSIPVAIAFPDIKVTAVDSIGKKIRAIDNIKEKLSIRNLSTICARVENINNKFDIVTARAVSSLDKICNYALPKLKKGGYFIAFKSRKAPEEIKDAEPVLKKYSAKIIDIIEYKLPLDEDITRNLIIIQI